MTKEKVHKTHTQQSQILYKPIILCTEIFAASSINVRHCGKSI